MPGSKEPGFLFFIKWKHILYFLLENITDKIFLAAASECIIKVYKWIYAKEHDMRRIRSDNLKKRITGILGNNEGASLVLVSVIAILVLTAVVILRVACTTFMASANRQLNQDQAYELAASLGDSIDVLISEGKFDLGGITSDETIYDESGFSGLPDTSVKAQIIVGTDVKTLKVTSKVGKAEYTFTREYRE